MTHLIHILHLSDIHLGTKDAAETYYTQLRTDLKKELKVPRLDYLVISGDIACCSTPDEYEAAVQFVEKVFEYPGLDKSRLIVVPGNHDLNWHLAENAYSFVFRRNLPDTETEEDLYISVGELGALKRDKAKYTRRFDHFSAHFYQKLCDAGGYPREYAEQGIVHEYEKDQILFLALNSAWEIDQHYRERAGIHPQAVNSAAQHLLAGDYEGWLKIAVCHHPVYGFGMIESDFMDRLAVHGFRICMHGHMHRAQEGYHSYDPGRGLYVVGAGTFGAALRDQEGIPLQYNLLQVDKARGTVTVNTREKRTQYGPWKAAAIWGDANDPKPSYEFHIRRDARETIRLTQLMLDALVKWKDIHHHLQGAHDPLQDISLKLDMIRDAPAGPFQDTLIRALETTWADCERRLQECQGLIGVLKQPDAEAQFREVLEVAKNISDLLGEKLEPEKIEELWSLRSKLGDLYSRLFEFADTQIVELVDEIKRVGGTVQEDEPSKKNVH